MAASTMGAKLSAVPRSLILLLLGCVPAGGAQAPQPTTSAPQALVQRALGNELHAAEDPGHPMRYRLRKTSPRLTTVKLIVDSKDGGVARLIAVNGQPLSPADEQKEQARLGALLADPGRQHHRKQGEAEDAGRAMKVLRALPSAFVYEPVPPDANTATPAAGPLVKFTFKPNPAFNAADLETQALTVMTGEIWIDAAHERVTHLEGHLDRDVDFGWGLLGRLNKGGTIAIDQAEVGAGQWRIVHFQMRMSGRVLFKAKIFDTIEDESDFEAVPPDLSYQKAIEILRAAREPLAQSGTPGSAENGSFPPQ